VRATVAWSRRWGYLEANPDLSSSSARYAVSMKLKSAPDQQRCAMPKEHIALIKEHLSGEKA
jgi:hypothetical protein